MTEYSGRTTHEVYIGDNPPTTSQLFRLASYAMSSARATRTHRRMRTKPRSHFSVQETHYINDMASAIYNDYPAEIRHRMAIRIGRRMIGSMPMKEWSLKFFDTYWYEKPENQWEGIRNLYRFEWVRDTVTLAEHRSTYVPQMEQTDMASYLQRVTVRDDVADLLRVEMELSQVTEADCELLIADVADYYRAQRTGI